MIPAQLFTADGILVQLGSSNCRLLPSYVGLIKETSARLKSHQCQLPSCFHRQFSVQINKNYDTMLLVTACWFNLKLLYEVFELYLVLFIWFSIKYNHAHESVYMTRNTINTPCLIFNVSVSPFLCLAVHCTAKKIILLDTHSLDKN